MMSTAALLAFLSLTLAGSVSGCGDGWVVSNAGSCYKFVTSPKLSWPEALNSCQTEGATLANLESLDEIYWMRGYRSYHSQLRVKTWIGGKLDEGVWSWTYDQETSVIENFNWAQGQPDGLGGSSSKASCLLLFGERLNPSQSYHFDDAECTSKRDYVCEKHLD